MGKVLYNLLCQGIKSGEKKSMRISYYGQPKTSLKVKELKVKWKKT